MPSKKSAVEFAELDADNDDELVVEDEIVVAQDLKTARIKGTWVMHWGLDTYNFEDGKRYRIPVDLYNFLKQRSCIYDTL